MNSEIEDPAEVGRWEPIRSRFHHLPVHMALLHTGRVLAFGGSGNHPPDLKRPFGAEIWNPEEGGDGREVAQNLPTDVFCSGHAFLFDGRLLVSGGTRRYDRLRFGVGIPPFRGTDSSYIFDPTTEAWTRMPDMRRGRWYPTLVGLPDGAILALAGLSKYFPWYFRRSAETFEQTMRWETRRSAGRWLPLYPRLHLVPGAAGRPGGVFYAGSFNTHYTFPFKLKSFPSAMMTIGDWSWRKLGLPQHPQREEGTSILLPLMPPDYRPKVMLIGGGSFRGQHVTPEVEVVDLGAETPVWEEHPAKMIHPRYYPYTVILPDRRLLVVGGRRGRGEHPHGPPSPMPEHHPHPPSTEPQPDPEAIHETEIFDPGSQTWQQMSSMAKDRLYHSNAILLPDGRVMVAGSNIARGTNELTIELYSPPYLFGGDRPRIEHAPAQIRYAAMFELTTSNAGDISEVALMRPSATTHCFDTEQRYVGLRFSASSDTTILAEAPADRFVAPPGYYMIFILRDGIPSKGTFLQLA